MKSLNNYIQEKLIINKDYTLFPDDNVFEIENFLIKLCGNHKTEAEIFKEYDEVDMHYVIDSLIDNAWCYKHKDFFVMNLIKETCDKFKDKLLDKDGFTRKYNNVILAESLWKDDEIQKKLAEKFYKIWYDKSGLWKEFTSSLNMTTDVTLLESSSHILFALHKISRKKITGLALIIKH